jgi:hypothetical protein
MAIQLTNWYNKQLDPEEMRKLYAWAEATCSSSDEYMQLTDFPKISSTTQNSSLNYTLDAVLDKIEKPEGWKKQINNEAKTEVFDDLETEFGIDFRPPIELP